MISASSVIPDLLTFFSSLFNKQTSVWKKGASSTKYIKDQSYWLSIDPKSTQAKTKRSCLSKFPILKEALSLWVSKAELHHQTLTGSIIRFKAFQFAEQLHIDNFCGSEGWLLNFKK